ncbi:MAG: MFS transporter [Pseudomonadota bacterium]
MAGADTARHGAHGTFARFLGAVGLSNTADGIAVVAWAWTASLLTRDPLYIALLPATLRLPWVFFALPSGILADRADRRRLIVICDLIRAAAYGVAALAIVLHLPLAAPAPEGPVHPGLYAALMALGLIVGCAEVARDNAAQTMLPAIVASERLEWANGWISSIETVGNNMAGPAVGAFMIALFLPLPYLAIALALLAAALVTAALPGIYQAEARRVRDWKAEIREGIAFVIRHPMLRFLVILTGLWNFFAEMAMIALVLHVQENLGLGAQAYGLILGAGALGGVAGGVAVAPLLRRMRRGTLAQWVNLISAGLFLLIAIAPGAWSVTAILFLFFGTGVIWNTLSVSYRQRVVPDAIRGRVNSVYRLFAWGMMPVGLVASGLVVRGAETILAREVALILPFVIAGTGILILSIMAWRPLGQAFGD